ncbi:MAG: gamma-glutamylcyclotransferase [Desulfovibrionaceae bacterium]
MIYFAYGSNLDSQDLRRWCAENGHAYPLQNCLGPTWLPDHELAFTLRSSARNGGVLDVVHCNGRVVQGVLFEVPDDKVAALDAKEGVPNSYQRRPVRVVSEEGREASAETYMVVEGKREAFVPPDREYVEVVARGLAEHGLDDRRMRALAKGADVPSLAPRVFAYGTLMAGERNHHHIEGHHTDTRTATVAGRLVSLGGFPGLLPPEKDSDTVRGELYTMRDFDAVLKALDGLEGFHGAGNRYNLFNRKLILANVGRRRVLCWCYVYNGEEGDLIESGSWRDPDR